MQVGEKLYEDHWYGNRSADKAEVKADEGEFLGLIMISEEGTNKTYGMRAILSKESTLERPIVQVISDLNGKKEVFHADISKINPKKASRLEIFALCSYEDKYGTGTGSPFGSFHTFQMCEEAAKQNGLLKWMGNADISVCEQFRAEKLDWLKIGEASLETLCNFDDPRVTDLFLKGKKLMELFKKIQMV